MRFQDIAKNMTITHHVIAGVFYFFNEAWFYGLPSDLQQLVLRCADDAAAYQAELDTVDHERAMEAMIAGGLTVHTPTDIGAWRAACAHLVDEFRGRGPQWGDFIGRIQAIR